MDAPLLADDADDPRTGPIPPRAAADETWTDETDVVVVGLGCAGACAALGAAESRLEVVVLERAADGGGTELVHAVMYSERPQPEVANAFFGGLTWR